MKRRPLPKPEKACSPRFLERVDFSSSNVDVVVVVNVWDAFVQACADLVTPSPPSAASPKRRALLSAGEKNANGRNEENKRGDAISKEVKKHLQQKGSNVWRRRRRRRATGGSPFPASCVAGFSRARVRLRGSDANVTKDAY